MRKKAKSISFKLCEKKNFIEGKDPVKTLDGSNKLRA
jgi:hypothetical protein